MVIICIAVYQSHLIYQQPSLHVIKSQLLSVAIKYNYRKAISYWNLRLNSQVLVSLSPWDFPSAHPWPVACRGCWMPGANEVLGCLRKYFIFVPQNCWQPFLVVHQNFLVIYPNFIFFRISCQILRKFAPWMPPSAASCPSKDIFLFFFGHLPTFSLGKLALWMPPRVDARGRRTVRTPLCTPLPRTKVFFPGYFPYTLSNRL